MLSGTAARGELRVAAVIANESVSGPGRQLAALAVALTGMGARFLVIILHRRGNPHPAFASYLERLGVECVLVEDRGPLDAGVVRRVRETFAGFEPAVLQTHGYKATAVGWALRASGYRIPWLGFFHGETHEDLKARFYHWLDHRMLGAADRVVVMSLRQKQGFARLGDRVRMIHNSVLPEMGSGGEDDAARIDEVAATLAKPRLGVIGRLSPEKGVEVFLEACALLATRNQPWSAIVAGEGPLLEELRSMARRFGVEERVAFLGTVRNMPALYARIDVLVIPSHSEGLPNVLLEAIGAGVPVVATSVGAIPEVLTDDRVGIIVPPGDPRAIAEAIGAAYALRSRPDATSAFRETASAFSVARRVEHHLRLYRELLGGESAEGGQQKSS